MSTFIVRRDQTRHSLDRDCAAGKVHRVVRGVYSTAEYGAAWESATAMIHADTHRPHVGAGEDSARVYSHSAAAILHRIPLIAAPTQIEYTRPGAGGRNRGLRVVYNHRLPSADVAIVKGVRCTAPIRTALDLACRDGVDAGIVALEHLLRHCFIRDADVAATLNRMGRRSGIAAARSAVEDSTRLSDSPLESLSRLRLGEIPNLPQVSQQHSIVIDGVRYRADFYWEISGHKIVGECDGWAKYGQTQAEQRAAFRAEQRREEALFRAGYVVFRWGWADVVEPHRLRALVSKVLRSLGINLGHC